MWVSLGGRTKTPLTGGLNRAFISHSSGGWKSEPECWPIRFLGWGASVGRQTAAFRGALTWQRERRLWCLPPVKRAQIPLCGPTLMTSPKLSPSPRPHALTPSHGGRALTWILGGTDIPPKQGLDSGHLAPEPGSQPGCCADWPAGWPWPFLVCSHALGRHPAHFGGHVHSDSCSRNAHTLPHGFHVP